MMTPLRQRMLEELQRRNYCSGTIRLYLRHVADFAQHFHRSPGAEQIRQYQLFLIQQKKLAWSSYNQIVCALRFFYAKGSCCSFLENGMSDSRKARFRVCHGAASFNAWLRQLTFRVLYNLRQ